MSYYKIFPSKFASGNVTVSNATFGPNTTSAFSQHTPSQVNFFTDSSLTSSVVLFRNNDTTQDAVLGYSGGSSIFYLNNVVSGITITNSGVVTIPTSSLGVNITPSYPLHAARTTGGSIASVLALTNASTNTGTGTRILFNLSTNTAATAYIDAVRTNSGGAAATYIDFVTNSGGSNVAALRLTEKGGWASQGTITTPGTTGNRTINKTCGQVNIAAGGTSVTVTNSLVTANSIVMAIAASADTTAQVRNVTCTGGSFTINTAAVTAETPFRFLVVNPL